MELHDWDHEVSLALKGENHDSILLEELIRRADGLPPRTDYVRVYEKTLWQKIPSVVKFIFFVIVLTLGLGVVDFIWF